jgi:hypothetical protein
MIPIVRLYESEADAETAVSNLKEDGFPDDSVVVLKPGAGDAERVAETEVAAGRLPKGYRGVVARSLTQGRCVVSVQVLQYGAGPRAVSILEASNAVDTELLPSALPDSYRTASDFFGIPALTTGRLVLTSHSEGLANFQYVLDEVFGLGPLSSKAAPLSDLLNLPAVQARKQNWTVSMGLPLRSSDPAPFSTLLNRLFATKLLYDRPKTWTKSFGYPLLSASRTPLSDLLGLPVLTGRAR